RSTNANENSPGSSPSSASALVGLPFTPKVIQTPGSIEGQRIQTETAELFGAGNYPALEKRADEYRKAGEFFTDGAWKLEVFYNVLGLDRTASDEECMARINRL